jgi:prolipoprotein diacylglyceryltransferase
MLWLEARTNIRDRRGALTGILLALIFSARFVIEFVKEPQEAFEAALPLDLGQLLSLPVIAIGLLLLVVAYRAQARPANGQSPGPRHDGASS